MAHPLSLGGALPIVPVQNNYDAGSNYSFPAANFINGTLTVTQATTSSVAVNAQSVSIPYDGQAHLATATTNPPGLNVTFTYNGGASAVNAGVYPVVATITA